MKIILISLGIVETGMTLCAGSNCSMIPVFDTLDGLMLMVTHVTCISDVAYWGRFVEETQDRLLRIKHEQRRSQFLAYGTCHPHYCDLGPARQADSWKSASVI